MSEFFLGCRVTLTLAGLAQGIGKRGGRNGRVIGINFNAGETLLQVERDGVKQIDWYLASYWQLVLEKSS